MTSKTESMTAEEALSAMVDGELEALPRNRILGRLGEDPELRGRWARYHAGRAILEGAEPGLIGADFSERVATAISAEPPIVAPAASRGFRRPIRWPTRGHLAVAAAVAVVATVAVSGLSVLSGGAFESSAPVVVNNDAGTPVAGGDPGPLDSGTYGASLAPAEQERVRQRLAMYLNSHNRFADAGEMPNVMPSVMPGSRVVAFNAGP